MRLQVLRPLFPMILVAIIGVPPGAFVQRPSSPVLKKIQVNGVEVTYTEAGSGEPVVLVHGSLVDYRYSLPLMRELAPRYRVINYSRRCHAPNPCPRGAAYSFQLHADDLATLIRELALAPAHIVGHSSGGAVALYMAQRHPELVRSLTLVEPGLYGLMPTHDRAMQVRQEMAAAGERARSALAHDLDEEAVRQLVELALRPRRFADIPADMRAMLLENAPSLRASVAAAAPPPQFTCDGAKQLRMPILLLRGEKSAPEFQLVNDELQRCIPHARRVSISSVDHNLFYEVPAPLGDTIVQFIRDLKK